MWIRVLLIFSLWLTCQAHPEKFLRKDDTAFHSSHHYSTEKLSNYNAENPVKRQIFNSEIRQKRQLPPHGTPSAASSSASVAIGQVLQQFIPPSASPSQQNEMRRGIEKACNEIQNLLNQGRNGFSNMNDGRSGMSCQNSGSQGGSSRNYNPIDKLKDSLIDVLSLIQTIQSESEETCDICGQRHSTRNCSGRSRVGGCRNHSHGQCNCNQF